ncbi:conserved Plasmodium protein, unknown function [Plasmodium gallinaceum]|uniref:Uncharacterized protein n=1 Tax=Plasmodium gallinaceum TaxID=5849 RepID=A0A1J1GZ34_PLAGA|nr:conserved Plasmodium protein, unknown function [Plasmodium gallinaceum]CRG97567.1 conserved Plasmodium protein, unknown function [Plasmodium gallinaceum]
MKEKNTEKDFSNEEQISSSDDTDKENIISLRGFNISYKKKLEKLKTIDKIDNNKKIIKLILEDIQIDPKEIMQRVVNLLKEKAVLNGIIEINDQLYKIKYKEVIPDDNILFPEDINNIINCKHAYIGILKISKYTKKCTFNEKYLQKWQNESMDF